MWVIDGLSYTFCKECLGGWWTLFACKFLQRWFIGLLLVAELSLLYLFWEKFYNKGFWSLFVGPPCRRAPMLHGFIFRMSQPPPVPDPDGHHDESRKHKSRWQSKDLSRCGLSVWTPSWWVRNAQFSFFTWEDLGRKDNYIRKSRSVKQHEYVLT